MSSVNSSLWKFLRDLRERRTRNRRLDREIHQMKYEISVQAAAGWPAHLQRSILRDLIWERWEVSTDGTRWAYVGLARDE